MHTPSDSSSENGKGLDDGAEEDNDDIQAQQKLSAQMHHIMNMKRQIN